MSKKPVIIDTREPYEYQISHVKGAINIASGEFQRGDIPERLQSVAKDQQIILYCRSGQRANTCILALRQCGFTNLINGISENSVRRMLRG